MPITVQCPNCDKKLKVRDELAGKRVKCPACGAVIPPSTSPAAELVARPKASTVDSATPEEPPHAAAKQSAHVAAESSPKKTGVRDKKSQKAMLFAGVGAAVLLCGLGLWYFWLKGASEAAPGPLDLPGASGVPLADVGKPAGFMPLKRTFLFFPDAASKAETSSQLVDNMFSGKLAGTYPEQGKAWSQVFPSGTKVILVGVAFSPPPPNGTKVTVRVLSNAGTVALRGTPGSINLFGNGEIISLMACYPANGAFLDGPYQIEVIINDVKCALLNLSVGN